MATRKKILIIEDELINRELLRIFLEKKYILTFADNLETAIDLIETISFNLIITDIRLGGKRDGIKVLQQCRNSKLNPKAPVLAYSASGVAKSGKGFIELGFDDFLSKPIDAESTLRKIDALMH